MKVEVKRPPATVVLELSEDEVNRLATLLYVVEASNDGKGLYTKLYEAGFRPDADIASKINLNGDTITILD